MLIYNIPLYEFVAVKKFPNIPFWFRQLCTVWKNILWNFLWGLRVKLRIANWNLGKYVIDQIRILIRLVNRMGLDLIYSQQLWSFSLWLLGGHFYSTCFLTPCRFTDLMWGDEDPVEAFQVSLCVCELYIFSFLLLCLWLSLFSHTYLSLRDKSDVELLILCS